MRIMAVDPGEKHIGIAISDPTGTIAAPLAVVKHVSRMVDAAAIADLARQNEAGMIIVGSPIDEEGISTPQARRAERLALAIQTQSEVPVTTWDESFSTQDARQRSIEMGIKQKKRGGHLDDLAAMIILQSFIDSKG